MKNTPKKEVKIGLLVVGVLGLSACGANPSEDLSVQKTEEIAKTKKTDFLKRLEKKGLVNRIGPVGGSECGGGGW